MGNQKTQMEKQKRKMTKRDHRERRQKTKPDREHKMENTRYRLGETEHGSEWEQERERRRRMIVFTSIVRQ